MAGALDTLLPDGQAVTQVDTISFLCTLTVLVFRVGLSGGPSQTTSTAQQGLQVAGGESRERAVPECPADLSGGFWLGARRALREKSQRH